MPAFILCITHLHIEAVPSTDPKTDEYLLKDVHLLMRLHVYLALRVRSNYPRVTLASRAYFLRGQFILSFLNQQR